MAFAITKCTCHNRLPLAACAGPESKRRNIVCCASVDQNSPLKALKGSGAALLLTGALSLAAAPALADLNKYEQAAGGEFGSGSALQFGSAEAVGRSFDGENLRRANFTAANLRGASFKNSQCQGAYFIKAVAYKTDFSGADLSDVLMDRAVLNEANLTDAVLERAVFTRSDLTDATIQGADFSGALLDKPMQQKLCKYADGTNSRTGINTRESLGCGSRRRFRESVPSNPDGIQVQEEEKEAFRKTLPTYGRAGLGRQ